MTCLSWSACCDLYATVCCCGAHNKPQCCYTCRSFDFAAGVMCEWPPPLKQKETFDQNGVFVLTKWGALSRQPFKVALEYTKTYVQEGMNVLPKLHACPWGLTSRIVFSGSGSRIDATSTTPRRVKRSGAIPFCPIPLTILRILYQRVCWEVVTQSAPSGLPNVRKTPYF